MPIVHWRSITIWGDSQPCGKPPSGQRLHDPIRCEDLPDRAQGHLCRAAGWHRAGGEAACWWYRGTVPRPVSTDYRVRGTTQSAPPQRPKTKAKAKPARRSEWNKNFNLKEGPKIWQAAESSGCRLQEVG